MSVEIYNPGAETSIKVISPEEGEEPKDIKIAPVADLPDDLLSGYNSYLFRVERRGVEEENGEPEISYAVVGKLPEETSLVGGRLPGGRRSIVIEYRYSEGEGGEPELTSPTNPADIFGIDPEVIREKIAGLIKEDMDQETE